MKEHVIDTPGGPPRH